MGPFLFLDIEKRPRKGEMYVNGQGVPQDYAQAHMWLRKGAEQGNSLLQVSLGFLYETGKGVPQDYVQAHMWYNLAASDPRDMDNTASQMRGNQDDARSDLRSAAGG